MTSHIADLKPDPQNARKHNPRNIKQIVDSLQEVGAARSIVLDENNVILAGNGVIEAAAIAGIENVRIVEASGNEIIAVKRKNLTPEQKKRLALFDNRAGELAEWDVEQLYNDREFLEGMFSKVELDALFDQSLLSEEHEQDEYDETALKSLIFNLPRDEYAVVVEFIDNMDVEGEGLMDKRANALKAMVNALSGT